MKIVIDEDSGYAPGCYLICQVDGNGDWDPRDEERMVLVQTDWDYLGLASLFGWSPCCADTDGTVDCCKTASEMIGEARDVIGEHPQEPVEDPGYFS